VAAVVTHLAAWGLRRLKWPRPVALGVTVLVVAALGPYLVFPQDLTVALPVGHSWHALAQALDRLSGDFATMVTPARAAPEFTVLAVWGVGVVAAAGDWLAFRVRWALPALAPALALFVVCCSLGTARGRTGAVGIEVAALVAFFLVHRITVGRRDTVWLGGRHGGASGRAVAVGTACAALATVAAIGGAALVPGAEGTGVLGWKLAGGGGGANRITPSPFDELKTRLLTENHTPVMTVRSSQPSYWRLTSLDTFTGAAWQSSDSYQAFDNKLPGVAPPPKGARQVVEDFHIQALDSIWLPAAFDPEAVIGGHRITWDPVSGSLISSEPTANGENYQVTSIEELASLNPRALTAVPRVAAGTMTRYLSLPPIPEPVAALAGRITAGATTEYAKAYALEAYFHTSAFTYSMTPPNDDSTNALEDFLFDTRSGYCQQYAGAYAVLARLAGLPTRIAVGFQSGTRGADGVYQVTDADAHAWPEVYFPTVGWVPFEPTPGRQVPGGSGYTGVTEVQAQPAATPTTTVPATPPTTAPSPKAKHPAAAPHAVGAPAPSAPRRSPAGLSPLVLAGVVVASLLGALVLAMVSCGAARRLRWRRRALDSRASGSARVLGSWIELAEALAWWGVRRRGDETVTEFAHRAEREVRALLGRSEWIRQRSAGAGGRVAGGAAGGEAAGEPVALVELSALVERATFAAGGVEATDAARARAIAQDLVARLDSMASAGKRLTRLLDPRQAWGPPTVDPPSSALPASVDAGAGW
jgi:transglutaminase-like putative cysteine protease